MHDESTRERVLGLIARVGPINASALGEELNLTATGVRRHLAALEHEGLIEDHDPAMNPDRGRGRPARSFVATSRGHASLTNGYAGIAAEAMNHMRTHNTLADFVEAHAAKLEATVSSHIDSDAPLEERVEALANALGTEGYATSVRPVPGGTAVQLCQGHCPVQKVAEEAPEWCEAETRMISRVLDVHVQRLSTLTHGAHVCTTHIPLTAGTTGGKA